MLIPRAITCEESHAQCEDAEERRLFKPEREIVALESEEVRAVGAG